VLTISWLVLLLIIGLTIAITLLLWNKFSPKAKKNKVLAEQNQQLNKQLQQRQSDIDNYVINVTSMSAKMYAQNQLFLEQTARSAFNLISPELKEQLQQQEPMSFIAPQKFIDAHQKSEVQTDNKTPIDNNLTEVADRPKKSKRVKKQTTEQDEAKPQFIKNNKKNSPNSFSLGDWVQ